jgi:phosphatidate phosphatase PAH1
METSKSKIKRLNTQMTVEQMAKWLANNINPITLRRAVQIITVKEKNKRLIEELGYEE